MGDSLDCDGLAPTRPEIVQVRHSDSGEFDEIAIGHALSFLGLEQDVEVSVFEIQERRRAVWRAASVAGTGVSVMVEGGEGRSNQERQPERAGVWGSCQIGLKAKARMWAKWRRCSFRESKCSRMVVGW